MIVGAVLAAIVTVAIGLGIGYTVWGASTSAAPRSGPRGPAPRFTPAAPAPAPKGGAFLGVGVESPGAASGANPPSFTATTPSASGAYVVTVLPSSPAAKAGIVKGDTITEFDGHAVRSPATLQFDVLELSPGSRAKVEWVTAAGKHDAATVTLAERPKTGSAG